MHTTAIEAMRLYCVYAGTLCASKKKKNQFTLKTIRNIKMKHLKINLIFLLLLTLFSCKKKDCLENEIKEVECPETIDLGEFFMSDESLNFIPYDDSIQRIIFSDSTGNEIIGEVIRFDLSLSQTTLDNEYVCPQDSTQKFEYILKRQWKGIEININELDIKLRFNLFVSVSRGDQISDALKPDSLFLAEYFNIHLQTPIDTITSSNSRISITVNPRNHPIANIDTPNSDEYNLHGKEYYDVYHQTYPIQEGEYKILYNKSLGLIGIENHDKSTSIKYEYVE